MFEQQGYDRLKPLFMFILMYMGSSQRTRNPHLRAHLAEALEALLPYHKDEPSGLNNLGGVQRERLFKEHEHRKEVTVVRLVNKTFYIFCFVFIDCFHFTGCFRWDRNDWSECTV